jgi:hypothetical protein
MLQSLSPMVAVALERAQEARDWQSAAKNEEELSFWREMERRWMALARSYDVSERVEEYVVACRPDDDNRRAFSREPGRS